MVSAIIVAAGSSRRMGFDKLFAPLCGHPVVVHTLRAFSDTSEIDEIIVVTRDERMDEFENLVTHERMTKVKKIVSGGAERHRSVWNGLQAVNAKDSEYIGIHDGARPLVTPTMIRDCLTAARQHGAACCAAPVPDTVKRAGTDQLVQDHVERTGLWAMQTPQIFNSGLILQAYAQVMARNELVTDEVSAVQKLGRRVYLLRNTDWNLKITYQSDLELAEQVLSLREKRRVAAAAND